MPCFSKCSALLYTPGFSKWSIPCRVSGKKFVFICPFLATSPAHLICSHIPWISFFIARLSPASHYFLLSLGSKYFFLNPRSVAQHLCLLTEFHSHKPIKVLFFGGGFHVGTDFSWKTVYCLPERCRDLVKPHNRFGPTEVCVKHSLTALDDLRVRITAVMGHPVDTLYGPLLPISLVAS